jgi:hypothetical protein
MDSMDIREARLRRTISSTPSEHRYLWMVAFMEGVTQVEGVTAEACIDTIRRALRALVDVQARTPETARAEAVHADGFLTGADTAGGGVAPVDILRLPDPPRAFLSVLPDPPDPA